MLVLYRSIFLCRNTNYFCCKYGAEVLASTFWSFACNTCRDICRMYVHGIPCMVSGQVYIPGRVYTHMNRIIYEQDPLGQKIRRIIHPRMVRIKPHLSLE